MAGVRAKIFLILDQHGAHERILYARGSSGRAAAGRYGPGEILTRLEADGVKDFAG